jgi:hypothetical protein
LIQFTSLYTTEQRRKKRVGRRMAEWLIQRMGRTGETAEQSDGFLVHKASGGFLFGNTRERAILGGFLCKQRPIPWRVTRVGRCLLEDFGESAINLSRSGLVRLEAGTGLSIRPVPRACRADPAICRITHRFRRIPAFDRCLCQSYRRYWRIHFALRLPFFSTS